MSDRESIDGTHLSPLFDLRVGATKHEISILYKILYRFHISTFIEIGVHEGGLTEYLLYRWAGNYMGIEINAGIPDPIIKDKINRSKNRLIFSNCFDLATVEEARKHLHTHLGVGLVYCDGGNKKEEIKIYNKILRSGDILLTHDFHDGVRKVREIENYTTWEVGLGDIDFMEKDDSFIRLPEELLKETRLVGWIKQ